MNEQMDLSELSPNDSPEIVKHALARFRRRIVLIGLVIALVAAGAGAVYTYERTTSPEVSLRKSRPGLPELQPVAEGGSGSQRWAVFAYEDKFREGVPCLEVAGSINVGSYCVPQVGQTSGQFVDFYSEKAAVPSYTGALLPAIAVFGIGPEKVRKVKIIFDSRKPITLDTKRMETLPYRVFGGLFPTPGEITRVDAYDKAGKLIPPIPYSDARRKQSDEYGSLNEIQKRAADVAVAASSDINATVLYSHGPYPLSRALSLMSPAVAPALRPTRDVIVVELTGNFVWKRFAWQYGKTTSQFAYYFVDAETLEVVYGAASERWAGNPASDSIESSLKNEPDQ